MNGELRAKILSAETLVPVGVLVALLGPLIAGTWMASQMFYGFTARLESLERSVTKNDRWTFQMESASWREFQANNPSLRAPNTEQIHADWTQ